MPEQLASFPYRHFTVSSAFAGMAKIAARMAMM
jgi:hypothetical protein